MMKGGDRENAGILCQMQGQERNERPESHYHEKWQACHSGNMPDMWNQDVPYWQGLTLSLIIELSRAGTIVIETRPLLSIKNAILPPDNQQNSHKYLAAPSQTHHSFVKNRLYDIIQL
jgi:hypothetical protein